MKFVFEFPHPQPGTAADPYRDAAAIARAAEAAGFAAIGFTDHPAPSAKWLDSVGHDSLDPFVAMAYCAAATSRIRVMSYVTIASYRNPLLLAKALASVDVLSGGRTILGLSSGYLRSEFAALGADFERRGRHLDETAEVLTRLWSSDTFQFSGLGFEAFDQVSRPAPVQLPHPPLWFAGNSDRVLERVARWGQGWAPLLSDARQAQSVRSNTLSEADLSSRIAELRERLRQAGRPAAAVDVLVKGKPEHAAGQADEHNKVLAALGSSGVTAYSPVLGDRTPADVLSEIARYGRETIGVVNPAAGVARHEVH